MKDITVQVVKSDKGDYRVVVTDDGESENNPKPNDWKCNTTVYEPLSKDKMLAQVDSTIKKIE
jgi:hypothetical protein